MSSLEAKIVVLGSQGVGKTSLLARYCTGDFSPSVASTVGASMFTKRVQVDESIMRLQLWDTAGQERFRSITRLYYRGANACILCYSITDAQSFIDMGMWLTELRHNLPADIVLHIVGTKADLVARDPTLREVPLERSIAYVAENLAPGMGSTPPPTAGGPVTTPFSAASASLATADARSPSSKRSSGFWGQEAGWDACHEVSAESGEGVDEVFQVVTRKLVEQNRRIQAALFAATATPGITPGIDTLGSVGGVGVGSMGPSSRPFGSSVGGGGASEVYSGYFDGAQARGSFRVGRDRRSWLFSPGFSPSVTIERGAANPPAGQQSADEIVDARRKSRCC